MDVDGVLYRWSDTANFLLKRQFGYDLVESTSWNYIKESVAPEHWKWLWADGVLKHGLFRHGNCYPGSFEAMGALKAMGHEIVILTSRPDDAIQDTLDWVAYHRIPTSEVHILGPGKKKSTVTPACDICLDDNADNVRDLETTGAVSLLWDRPWNRDAIDLARIFSWDEFLRVVEGAARTAEAA
jgi:uncharacterized HAD superfamily protein